MIDLTFKFMTILGHLLNYKISLVFCFLFKNLLFQNHIFVCLLYKQTTVLSISRRIVQMFVNESSYRIEYESVVLRTTYRNLNLNDPPFDCATCCPSLHMKDTKSGNTFYQRCK